MTNQPIFIIGAGAIGKALAVLLQRHGRRVTLLRARPGPVKPGLQVFSVELPDGKVVESAVEVSTVAAAGQLEGIVVLTTKSFANAGLAMRLAGKTGKWPLVLLQNGLDIEQPFRNDSFPNLYRSVLLATCQELNESRLRFRPVASSPIGTVTGTHAQLLEVTACLNSPVFPFNASDNLEPLVWEKVIVNCVFNSICPLLEADNGIFTRDARVLGLARRMIGEGVALAGISGIHLQQKAVEQRLLAISARSSGQEISTLQDIRQGRQTELDSLNLQLVRRAASLGAAHLTREIGLLGELTLIRAELASQKMPLPETKK